MRKILVCLLCCILVLGLCGCEKEKDVQKGNTNNEQNKVTENIKETEKETNKEEIKKEETTSTTSKPSSSATTNKKQEATANKQENTTKKEETTTKQETTSKKEESSVSNNNSEKEENLEKPKEEIIPPKEEINKKIVVCTMNDEGSYYTGIITHTTTFENDTIIHNKLYVEKYFKEGHLAEEDNWTISHIELLNNNTKVGLTGNVDIRNNITYLTVNYDVKVNPKLIELITKHTEYNDFLNHMTTNNGYSCITK